MYGEKPCWHLRPVCLSEHHVMLLQLCKSIHLFDEQLPVILNLFLLTIPYHKGPEHG